MNKRIIMPLLSLKNAFEELKKGNYNVSIRINGDSEMIEIIKSFNNMIEKLKVSRDREIQECIAKRELLANIAHDLRTPLTVIEGYSEIMESNVELSEEKKRKYLEFIHKNIIHLNSVVNELYLYSQVEMGEYKFSYEKVELVSYVQEVIEEQKLILESKDMEIKFLKKKCSRKVCIDTKQMYQVIKNILFLVIKYSNLELKKIYIIICEHKNNTVLLQINNTSSRFKYRKVERIYESFNRIDQQRAKESSSSGLKLIMTNIILNKLNGDLNVYIGENNELSFEVILPLVTNSMMYS